MRPRHLHSHDLHGRARKNWREGRKTSTHARARGATNGRLPRELAEMPGAGRLRTPDTVELGWTQRGENEPEVGAWKEGLRGGEFLAEINEHCIVGRRAQAMEPHV